LVVALSPNIWKTPGSSTTKTLADGSRIEMRAGAEAVVENVPDGLMVRLNSGSMMVFAAKRSQNRERRPSNCLCQNAYSDPVFPGMMRELNC
jgi:ferric-dicitrate binding protein FerR (iron transport regulator)